MATSRNNVRKRGTTWTYYAYVTDGTGKRRQISKGGFATRREAEAARVEALSTMANGTWVRPERLTVRDFLVDEWLPTQRPPTLEESTYTSYARNIRLHVAAPHRRPRPPAAHPDGPQRALPHAARVRPPTARRAAPPARPRHPRPHREAPSRRAHLAAGGRRGRRPGARPRRHHPPRRGVAAPSSPRTEAGEEVRARAEQPDRALHPHDHPRGARATRCAGTASPATSPTPPLPHRRARRGEAGPTCGPADQLGLFLDYVADSPYLPAWLYLATSGSRRGEVLGLKWDDVDLDAATAIMSRQVTMVDHRMVIKELPKTKAGHMILLDPGTVEMLANHREHQAEDKRLLGAGYHDDGWIFCRPDGTPAPPRAVQPPVPPQAGDLQQGQPRRAAPRDSSSTASATPGRPSPSRKASTSTS